MKYDFCEELKDIYKSNLFDNDLIRYYLNGFIEALNIDLEKGNINFLGFDEMPHFNNGKKYSTDTIIKKDDDCSIKVLNNKHKNKRWIRVEGNDDNIEFCLDIGNISQRTIKKVDKDNLPFKTWIVYKKDEMVYTINISQDFLFSNIILSKYQENDKINTSYTYFTLTRNDFENALNFIMKFLSNPDAVIDYYKNIVINYHEMQPFYRDDITKIDEIMLDKNGKKLEKVLNNKK